MCDGSSVELRQQFSYEYETKKNIWNIWNILLKENMRNSVIGGHKRKNILNILNILHKDKHCVQWVERWATTAIFL